MTERAKRVTLSIRPPKFTSLQKRLMQNSPFDPNLAREAKAIVAIAFRNGPIENLHAGKQCSACHGKISYSRITDAEMKAIMKNAVDYVYKFGVMKKADPVRYNQLVDYGNKVASEWDEPDIS